MIEFKVEGKALEEIWKSIKGYERHYEVSNLGRIRRTHRPRTKGGILKELYSSWGYNRINLYTHGKMKAFSIHRIVAETFVPNPENKPQVNHIDGNKFNNSASNLEWVTQSENQLHAYEIGLQKVNVSAAHKVAHKKNGKTVAKLDDDGNIIGIFSSSRLAAESIGMKDGSHISSVARGSRNRCGGYKWKYLS